MLTAIRQEKEARRTEEDRKRERRQLLASHLAFTVKFFKEKEGQPFSVAEFHRLICDVLDQVFRGDIIGDFHGVVQIANLDQGGTIQH